MSPRPQSIPDAELPCIEHGMTLEHQGGELVELKRDSRDTRDRLLKLETEQNSRTRVFATLLPVLIALLSAAISIWSALRRH